VTHHLTMLETLTSLAVAAGEGHAGGAGAMREAPQWVLAIALLPFAAFLLNGVCAALKVRNLFPAWLTIGTLATSFGLTLYLFLNYFTGADRAPMHVHGFEWIHFQWGATEAQTFISNFAFYIDGLTCLWILFVTGLATLIALYSSEYMNHDVGLGYCRFFAAFSLFVFSMLVLVMADNLLLMFLGWEGVGLCSYLLIGYFYKKPAAVAAAKKAFIINRIGDLGLLMAIFSAYGIFGTVEYSKIFSMVAANADGAGNLLSVNTWAGIVLPLLLTAGAFGKSAQLFFYVWLPDAMEGPTPVSALIHAATMVTAGVFLIARLYPVYTIDPGLTILTLVAWSGAITAFWAATIEMAIFDIKRVMGYSTISQLGFMFAGLGLLSPTGAAFHTFTHAFFKATLFLGVGAVMHGFGGQLDLRRLSGVAWMRGFGLVGIAMLIGSINLSGVPFTAGFFSKDMILAQGFTTPSTMIGGAQIVAWILLITAGMTAYYTFRTFFRVYTGPKEFNPGDDAELLDLGRHPKGTNLEQWHKEHGHGHGHGHDHSHDHGHAHDHGAGSVADRRLQTRIDFDPTTEEFDPHPPGWAMKAAILACMLCSILAAGLYFMKTAGPGAEHGGWVGGMIHPSSAHFASPEFGKTATHMGQPHEPAAFFGQDAHKLMYYVSAGVGLIGILIAAFLHGPKGWQGLFIGNRVIAEKSRADGLINLFGPITKVARNKWYVDEIYDAIIVKPLHVLSHIFHLIDQYIVDGIVNLCGAIPRWIGKALRPTQSGEIHGYAIGMAGGVAVLLVLVFVLTS
jgi:NADH-quinone oxidoreductase subunit L